MCAKSKHLPKLQKEAITAETKLNERGWMPVTTVRYLVYFTSRGSKVAPAIAASPRSYSHDISTRNPKFQEQLKDLNLDIETYVYKISHRPIYTNFQQTLAKSTHTCLHIRPLGMTYLNFATFCHQI